ncbi:hypothetical protein [Wenzhouxiangella sediminis]|uniref:Uncharacterized protein n=1 Tax=Wenzhouxiangella sediminis TaxID=1792836 RepID=A0A3E1K5K8_9GAMM|nr:hypothetical protein [Wenzhouxiangella sediminis]RFF29220.1 hypothetical protein DZC52_14035 [Wenzhouxiangella sediminis]
MNGKEQIERYSTLINSDQKAPASPDWQPDTLAGFRIGDHVRLPSVDCPLRVVGLADPLLILESPSGHRLRAGWRAVAKVRSRAEIEGRS